MWFLLRRLLAWGELGEGLLYIALVYLLLYLWSQP